MKKLLKLSMLSLGVMASGATFAAGVCSVNYKTSNNWGTGGQEDIILTNTGSSVSSWELCWAFNGSEVVTNLWNGTYTANGKNICVKNAPYNASLAASASVSFGFTHNNAPGAIPTQFTLNGVACGGVATSSTPVSSSSVPSSTPTTSSAAPSSTPTTSSAPSSAAAAILIQAESYAAMQGIQTEGTSDTGGGMNVGWTDAGDWLSYPEVDLPCGGTYTVEYRVASQSTGGQLRLEKAGGTPVFGTLNFTATGGWQTWKTVSQSVTLPAGKLALGLAIPQGGWNLNWIRLIPNCGVVGSSSAPSSTPTTSTPTTSTPTTSSKVSSSAIFTTSTPTTSSRVSSSTPTTSTPTTSSSVSSSAPSTGARWLLDGSNSTFHFVSNKKIDVEENFTFTQLQGTVGADGKAVLTIPLASLSTDIDLRNSRMQSLLFESSYLPNLHFSTQLDLAAIDALPAGSISTLTLTGDLILHGVTKSISFDAMVVKHSDKSVSFSPRKAIIIDSVDFDLNAGIEALRAIMGLNAIAEKVPVYFKMYLSKDNPGNIAAIKLPTAPNAPLGFAGTVSNTTGNASLNWVDVSSGETGFLIRRKGADGRWATAMNNPANTVSYVDSLTTLGSGSYDYKVISYVDSVPSTPSSSVTVQYDGVVTSSSAVSVSSVVSSSAVSSSVVSSSKSSAVASSIDGKSTFEIRCAGCHALTTAFPSDKNLTTLSIYIRDKMPPQDPTQCGQDCASAVAYYLLNRNNVSSKAVSSSVVSSSVVSSSAAPSSKPVSSSSVIVVSSSAVSSSAAPSSKPTTSSSVSSVALNGQTLFTQQCASCHNVGNAAFPADKNAATLSVYIRDKMPIQDPSLCGQDCANAITTYLLNRNSSTSSVKSSSASSSVTPVACATQGPTYGPRLMRVLTKNEYLNSVRDLTGVSIATDLPAGTLDLVPTDSFINGFSNNTRTILSASNMKAYDSLATQIAAWSKTKNFAGVADCTNLNLDSCGAKFLDEFGPRVFRRPFTLAERNSYSQFFTTTLSGGDVKVALELALQTALTSPNFLYRSELGVSVADIRSGTTADPQYEMGTNLVSLPQNASLPIYQSLAGTYYNFTGDDLIEVVASGTPNGNGDYPLLKINTNSKVITSGTLVNNTGARTFQFRVTGITGNEYIVFSNPGVNNNTGHVLKITMLRFGKAKVVLPEVPAADLAALSSDSFVLTPYEMASFLAFTYTGSTPDVTLLDAAKNKALQTDAQIGVQVNRLLASAGARQHFGNFAAQWLDVDKVLTVGKDQTLYPNFTPAVRQAMASEVREVYNHVVLDEAEPFSTLFDSNYTFVNSTLAQFYGIPGVTGSTLQKVTGLTNRGGLLTSGAFLSVNAHDAKTAPVIRAVRIRRAVLCHDVPNPPTGVSLDAEREKAAAEFEALLAANGGHMTARDEYGFLTRSEVCQTCHKETINPLGFGFENFNAIGLPQTVDYNGLPVNSSGMLYGIDNMKDGQSFSFEGAKDFAHKLANLPVAQSCFIQNNFRMAFGTGINYYDRETLDANKNIVMLSDDERQSYACEMNRLQSTMAQANSPKAMLKQLGGLQATRYRKERVR